MRSNKFNDIRKAFLYSKKCNDFSIDNKKHYKDIIYGPAYNDFTPRTIKGLKKENITDALDYLVDEIYGYFHSDNLMIISRGDYDDWHHKTCKTFLDLFKRAGGKEIKYGKAQKIINMSMKYLYCFNDSNKYSEKFIFCHMPLDHYTLEWFIHVVIPWTVKTNDERVEITKIRDTSWGNLNYSKNKDIYSYSWMQERIFGYLQSIENEKYLNENNEPLTPLEAEFYIWPEQKFMERIKEAIDLDLYDINYPKYKDDDLFDLCNSLSTKLLQLQEKIK